MADGRTFDGNIKMVREAIQDVCKLLGIGIKDLYVSELKAVIDFDDGTTYWFMYSYSRVQREYVVTEMVDYFLSVKFADDSEAE
jgi:hypothetical protein